MNDHGEYNIDTIDQVIIVKAIGTWNDSTSIQFGKDVKEKAKQINSSAWATLIDLVDWDLGIPETEKTISELQDWCMKNGQRYEAIVLGQRAVKKYQMDRYNKNVDQSIMQQRYFASIEEARQWLSELGFFDVR